MSHIIAVFQLFFFYIAEEKLENLEKFSPQLTSKNQELMLCWTFSVFWVRYKHLTGGVFTTDQTRLIIDFRIRWPRMRVQDCNH